MTCEPRNPLVEGYCGTGAALAFEVILSWQDRLLSPVLSSQGGKKGVFEDLKQHCGDENPYKSQPFIVVRIAYKSYRNTAIVPPVFAVQEWNEDK